MCNFKVVTGDCSRKSLQECKKAKKEMEEQRERRVLEEFYEEVKNKPDMIEREYYMEYLKSKGFTF